MGQASGSSSAHGPAARETTPVGAPAVDALVAALPQPVGLRMLRAISRGLWVVISVAPALAAGVLPLVALTAGALPALGVAVGTFLATSGLTLLLRYVETWASAPPSPGQVAHAVAATLGAQAAASTSPASAPESPHGLATATPRIEQAAAPKVADVSYEHVVLRQRFVTQQMMPGAGHVRAKPAPIRSPAWTLVAPGTPDGMGYNWIANQGDGRRGDVAVLTLIDQIAIISLSRQIRCDAQTGIGPGELFYGPMVGGYVGSAMLLGEVGFAHAQGGPSFRVGGGGGFGRIHSTAIDWDRTQMGPNEQPTRWSITTSRKKGLWGMASGTGALVAHFNPLTRLDLSRQSETVWSQWADGAAAQPVGEMLRSSWATWRGNLRAAWTGRSPTSRVAPTLDDPRTLAVGESCGQTFFGRRGFLAAPADFGLTAGLSGLRQTSRGLTLRRVPGKGDEVVLQVTLAQQHHVSVRGFATFAGGMGYDRGGRGLTCDTTSVRMVLGSQAAAQALATVVAAVRHPRTDFAVQRALVRALGRDSALAEQRHSRVTGRVRSHELGTQVNLFPSEIFSKWLPAGFEPALAWQGQSVRLTEHALDLREQPQAMPQAIAVHHDHVRTCGPEGRQLCRTQAIVSMTTADEKQAALPRVQLAHHWEMTRADAHEVTQFILHPLAQLVGTSMGPLFGAGWRHERHATLARSFTHADLQVLAQATPDACKKAMARCSYEVPEAALLRLIGALAHLCGAQRPGQPWDASNQEALADAFEAWTFAAQLASVVPLHRLVAEGRERQGQLHLTTFAQPYVSPERSLQVLELAAAVPATLATLVAPCDRGLHDLDVAYALLQSDPLVGETQRRDLCASWLRVSGGLHALRARAVAQAQAQALAS